MAERLILKAIRVDENGNELSEEIVSDKEIIEPTDVSNFGYNREEQLAIMSGTQQVLLNDQAALKK
jgi:hypothetical protein